MKIPMFAGLLLGFVANPLLAGLLDFSQEKINVQTRDSSFTLSQADGTEAITARFEPTEKWSFVRIVPESGSWNLSNYTGLEVEILNKSNEPVKPGVRVDEEGDPKRESWNTANMRSIPPGASQTFVIRFGKDYNNSKPIDTSRIGAIHIFLGKGRAEASELVISNIKAVKD